MYLGCWWRLLIFRRARSAEEKFDYRYHLSTSTHSILLKACLARSPSHSSKSHQKILLKLLLRYHMRIFLVGLPIVKNGNLSWVEFSLFKSFVLKVYFTPTTVRFVLESSILPQGDRFPLVPHVHVISTVCSVRVRTKFKPARFWTSHHHGDQLKIMLNKMINIFLFYYAS